MICKGSINDKWRYKAYRHFYVYLRCAWPALFAMFIFSPSFAAADPVNPNKTGAIEALGKKESSPVKVERLGNELFKPGTAQKIQTASLELMRKQDLINTLLVMQAEHSFELVERNVDSFLDWYYSLSGEYMRIYKMVTGDQLDNYMKEKLIEHLQNGNPFEGFDRSLQDAVSQNAILVREHKAAVQRILDQNRIQLDIVGVSIIERGPMEKIINPSVYFDFKALRNSLLKSGAKGTLAGSMTSAVTGKIMEKIESRNILKMAAKALAKFAVAKATGSLGGASAGATVGSAIPGIGTAVGALVGIVIGGIIIDKGILKLEELMNREAFKIDIMGAITEVKRELTETMKPEPALFFQKY